MYIKVTGNDEPCMRFKYNEEELHLKTRFRENTPTKKLNKAFEEIKKMLLQEGYIRWFY